MNNLDVLWSLYAEMKGTDKPILLNPLSWKNGNQVDNLKKILEFFRKSNITEKTRILIYKSHPGSGKCCDKDTLILTNKGIIRIEDIVRGDTTSQKTIEESFIGEIKDESYIGSIVKSLNVNNIKFEDDFISNVFDMKENNTIDITTGSGFNIKCTSTHKLVIIDENCNVIFKEAKDISIGDSIAIACGTEIYGEDVDLSTFYQSDFYHRHRIDTTKIIIPEKMNEDIAELLGYAISEGDKFGEGLTLRISGDEQVIRDRIKSIINKLGIYSNDIFDDRRNIDDGVEISFVMFKDFLRFLGYIDGSKNKEIPWSILQSSKKVQLSFLKALFSGDGYVGNENKPNIEYYTTSKRMAEQLHIMLLNMGIFTSLREKAAICVKDGERKDCGICYRVSIFGRNDIIKYINTIGFIQDYKKTRCNDILKILDSRDSSFQSRTVEGYYIRLKRIYEEFKKLGKNGKIIKTWQEDVILGDRIWKVNRSKKLSTYAALRERGFLIGTMVERPASKKHILKMLKAMKECYYMKDFKYLYNIASSNIEFDVVEEKREGIGHVYDLTIRDNHSYVGNGFINHNSATLLHVIENMGRGIIVVPFRNLQRQYFDDYFTGKNKFVLKKNGQRLKVAVMLGRGNFPCKWLAEQYDLQQRMIKESEKPENYGIIYPVDDEILRMYKEDPTCANKGLLCNRPLQGIGKEREVRWSIGCQCPYWIPTPTAKNTIDKWKDKEVDERKGDNFYDDEIEGVNLPDIKKTISDINKNVINKNVKTRLDIVQDSIKCHNIAYYQSVGWGDTGVFIRDEVDKDGNPCPDVCPYYKQFYSYIFADCIVMNDAKWQLETMIGRKPNVSAEVFDEGDYWLDKRSVSLEFSRIMIDKMLPTTNKMQRLKENTLFLFDNTFKNIKEKVAEQNKGKDSNSANNIISSKNYRELFLTMTNMFLEYKKSVEEDDSILQRILDIYTVLKYIDKASISARDVKGGNKILSIFIPYPDNLLKEQFEKSSENIIITSGTIHSNFVLSNLFGINNDNYIVDFVEGRKESPGKLRCIKPKEGLLKVNHTNWQSPQFRMAYNHTLNYILDNLKIKIDQITGKPGEAKILVLTPAKKYAEGIIDRQDVFVDFAKGGYNDDSEDIKPAINTNLSDFMEKSIEDVRKIKPTDIEIDGDVLRTEKQIIVSTRMIRGADLKDNLCRAVVMTKWPMRDISSGYNQALKLRFGEEIFWSIMKDNAKREAIQYVSRGLRHERDWTFFSTPDEDAFNRVYMLFTYD